MRGVKQDGCDLHGKYNAPFFNIIFAIKENVRCSSAWEMLALLPLGTPDDEAGYIRLITLCSNIQSSNTFDGPDIKLTGYTAGYGFQAKAGY